MTKTYDHVETVTIPQANTDITINFSTSIQDGVNLIAIEQVEVWRNDFQNSTSTNAGTKVRIYRGSESTAEVETILDDAMVISRPPRNLNYKTTSFKMQTSTTGTYQVTIRTRYYKP